MAERVKQDEITLNDAAEKLGIKQRKKATKKKPKPRKQATQEDSDISTTNGALYDDGRSRVFDGQDGVRVFSCRNSSVYEHESAPYDVFVFAVEGHWRIRTPEDLDDSLYATRSQAEDEAANLIYVLAESALCESTITEHDTRSTDVDQQPHFDW